MPLLAGKDLPELAPRTGHGDTDRPRIRFQCLEVRARTTEAVVLTDGKSSVQDSCTVRFCKQKPRCRTRQPGLMPRCTYYSKRCLLLAPCCGEAVCCHRCHGGVSSHKLPRDRLTAVICDICCSTQAIHAGDTCLQCGTHFAAYFCSRCGIANNDVPAQGYFHCDECGICRIGRDDEYFHCSICNCCLKLDLLENHTHQTNCLDSDCPVCLQPMFDSQQPADKLPCGHMAHLDCINSSDISRDQICGLCDGRPRHSSGCESSSMAAARTHHDASRCEGSTRWQPAELVHDWSPESYNSDINNMLRNLEHVSITGSVAGDTTLQAHPKRFRQLLEKAVLGQIQSTAAENAAKGRAINQVVQLLHTATSRRKALELYGQQVSVDRVEVAGSVGQKMQVQGLFDVDLVAFLNLPAAVLSSIDVADPDEAQDSDWMQHLRWQLYNFIANLGEEVPGVTELRLGPTAITFTLTTVDHAGVRIPVDILLAPNLTAGTGSNRAAAQCTAVLAPLLTAANAEISGSSSSSSVSQLVRPSYIRTVWLAESYTDFCRSAAAAGGNYGRVVTTTVRLVKAWIRKGLQPRWPGFKQFKGFMAGLLVLKAAAQLPALQRVQGQEYAGRYVVDVLLLVLEEVQCWAAAAALSADGEEVEPVLFTDMAHEKYYSKQQAAALQAILRECSPQYIWGACRGQPVVVHPIDPLCNIFNQQVHFKLWGEFSQAAAELAYDLRHKSWKYIRTQSQLAGALTDM